MSRVRAIRLRERAYKVHDRNGLFLHAGVYTVAVVFVRINGQGVKLNQADFILTRMPIHHGLKRPGCWREGRQRFQHDLPEQPGRGFRH
jgi:hypothetical protein